MMILSLSVLSMPGCKKDSVDAKDKETTNESVSDSEGKTEDEELTADVEEAHSTADNDENKSESNSDTSSNDMTTEDTLDTTDSNKEDSNQGSDNNNTDVQNNQTTTADSTTKASSGSTGGSNVNTEATYSVSTNRFNVDTGISVHDPSIIKANGKYYIFGSHLAQASTANLTGRWSALGVQGYSNSTLYGAPLATALAEPYKWAGKKGDTADSKDSDRVWAPDVIWNPGYVWQDGSKGAYMLYSCTTATYIRSCIIYSVSKNVEGPYTYADTIIYSGFSKGDAYDDGSTVNKNVNNTNVLDIIGGEGNLRASYFNGRGDYNNISFPNAIDPNLFFDANGQLWMTYGSWSGGIWITKLDNKTGQPIHDYPSSSANGLTDKYFGKQIAAGGGLSCEAPYVLYDKTTGYYYLYVSYGGLASNGGYNMRLFRSKSPDGPYTDAAGLDARSEKRGNGYYNENHGVKFLGGYDLPSLKNGYLSPGHNSAFIDDDGKKYVVYHTRFETLGEWHQPRVHQMFANEQGWLCVSPFQTKGETISSSGYGMDDMAGTYYVVLQSAVNNTTSAGYRKVTLSSDGSVSGAYSGKWSHTDGKYYMQINIGGIQYYGVFLKMNDEAGNNCITFSAVGTNNQTLLGVKYLN